MSEADQIETGKPAPQTLVSSWRFGLSGKLLLATALFLLVAEVLVYVPSIANFRLNWLRDRLAAAHTAALVLDAAPSGMVPDELAQQVLDSIGARAVAMKMGQQRRLLAIAQMPPAVDDEIDLRSESPFASIYNAFDIMSETRPAVMRVVGPAPAGGQYLEVILDEQPLRAAMYRFSATILFVSFLILAIAGPLIYLTLHYMFVRPMWRITANLSAFHADPESAARIIAPSNRTDEIGMAERELSSMQRDLVSMLHQKNRLAALGLAVSKINHDLRNLLASAQLISDQLSTVPDPRVQRFAPKLMHTLERAIAFCQSTLSYGRAQEAAPDRRKLVLEPVVAEVRDSLGLSQHSAVTWITAVDRSLTVDADPEQLFRVLLNLARNSLQALEAGSADGSTSHIRIAGRREGAVTIIEVSDTGPGVPAKAREHLFEAFHGSARSGGTGLGLAIAAELVRAHGGDIRLVEGTIGATFRITIPDPPVELSSRRERARA
jgi:signal transduction histidine kinase